MRHEWDVTSVSQTTKIIKCVHSDSCNDGENGMCCSSLSQHVLADVWLVPVSEMGNVDRQLHCRTHLGHILTEGDLVWG